MGTYRRRGFFQPASCRRSGTLGVQVPSASSRSGNEAHVCFAPRILVLVPDHPRGLAVSCEWCVRSTLFAAGCRHHVTATPTPSLCQRNSPHPGVRHLHRSSASLLTTSPLQGYQADGVLEMEQAAAKRASGDATLAPRLAAACSGAPHPNPSSS